MTCAKRIRICTKFWKIEKYSFLDWFDVINEIDLATYDVPYPKDMPLTTQVIIFLDKFIDCPYYISPRSIIVTNEKKAVELTLFSGDLRKYGLTKAMSRTTEKGE